MIHQLNFVNLVNFTATELDRGTVTKTVDKWTHLSTHFPYYRTLTLIPLICSIIIVTIKYLGRVETFDETGNIVQSFSALLHHTENVSRLFSAGVWSSVCKYWTFQSTTAVNNFVLNFVKNYCPTYSCNTISVCPGRGWCDKV